MKHQLNQEGFYFKKKLLLILDKKLNFFCKKTYTKIYIQINGKYKCLNE